MNDLDLAHIGTALDKRFPELAPSAPCSVLGGGVNSIAIETASTNVFRIGRTARSCEGYRLEHRLLPAIAPNLPVELPDPRWLIDPCEEFPCGALGYPKIAGRALSMELFATLDKETLADAIAATLAALHGIDVAPLPNVPLADPRARRKSDLELHATTIPALRTHLSPEAYLRFDTFWQSYVADESMMEFKLRLTHGDVRYGNMLVDDRGHLSAVLDWEIARVGDPARDFAGLKYFGMPFIERVLERYAARGGGVDGRLRARIESIMVMRELYGVQWALEAGGERALSDAIERFRAAVDGEE